MLTLNNKLGKPVAIFKTTKGNNKIINYISSYELDDMEDKKKIGGNLDDEDLQDSIDSNDYAKDLFSKLTRKYRNEAKQNVKDILNGEDIEDPMANTILNKMQDESKRSIKFNSNKCMFLPDTVKRNIVYVAGASGSGKSYVSAEYARNYHLLFPKRNIFLFSKKGSDPAFDCLDKEIKLFGRVDPQDIVNEQELEARRAFLKVNDLERYNEYESEEKDEDLLKLAIKKYKKPEYTINYECFKNSLCIFDDTHTFTRGAADLIKQLQKDCMDLGRASNIEMIITNHLLTDGHKTRNVLNELTKLVLFPEATSDHQLKYCLEKQLGYSAKRTNVVKAIKSRWICFNRMPRYIVHQRGIQLEC